MNTYFFFEIHKKIKTLFQHFTALFNSQNSLEIYRKQKPFLTSKPKHARAKLILFYNQFTLIIMGKKREMKTTHT